VIELDDPVWSELKHAHGFAEDVPHALRSIERSKSLTQKFWDDLEHKLVHQWSIGSASLAAMPHLVRIAAANGERRKGFLALRLAAMILASLTSGQNGRLPRIREKEIDGPLRDAVAEGRRILASMMNQKRKSFAEEMEYLALIAAFDLRSDVAGMLWELQGGTFVCPRCEADVSVQDLYSY
jgi:hypothetical protein